MFPGGVKKHRGAGLSSNEPGGPGFEKCVRRIREGAAELAVHGDDRGLLKLCAHDDEIRAAQHVAEPRRRRPRERPAELQTIAADVVDELRDVPTHDDDSLLATRTRD